MIQEAIYTTVNPIVPAFPLIGDIDVEKPFSIYSVNQNPMYTKEGITGYDNIVQISVIDDDVSVVVEKGKEVRDAVLALEGEVNGTTIDFSVFVTSDVRYDERNGAYINMIQINIYTQNE